MDFYFEEEREYMNKKGNDKSFQFIFDDYKGQTNENASIIAKKVIKDLSKK